MSITLTKPYDVTLSREELLKLSMTPDELERFKKNEELSKRMNHQCDPPKLTYELGYGPGTLFSCDDCHRQKKVVYIGLEPFRDTDGKTGKPIGEKLPPLAWRNL